MTGDDKGRVAERPLTTAHPTVVTATGGDGGGAAGLPHLRAHLTATAASGGDGGGGAAARLSDDRRRRRLARRGGGATVHGRGRERGQTKEGDEVVLFIALD